MNMVIHECHTTLLRAARGSFDEYESSQLGLRQSMDHPPKPREWPMKLIGLGAAASEPDRL